MQPEESAAGSDFFCEDCGFKWARKEPPSQVIDIWERLFEYEESKDVTLRAKNGEQVKAHGLMLAQLSEALKLMLSAGMQESRTKLVKMEKYSKAQLLFLLRLAYTGCMDAKDCTTSETDCGKPDPDWALERAEDLSKEHARNASEGSRRPRSSHRTSRCRSESSDSASSSSSSEEDEPPIELLIGCAMYEVPSFLPCMSGKIQDRLD